MIRRAMVALVLALGLAGCGAGTAVSDLGKVVEGAPGATTPVEVRKGQRFSLSLTEGQWDLKAVPDAKVASFISEEHLEGRTYFVFNAKHPGSTRVEITGQAQASFSITVRNS
ncbi:hypothetical protein [Nonomuraea dietziae]|uniref:Uncharacterized protein n=1 Tax=Nonomuraea dietziae TaxID=65515 RepID=A0A7W5V753_9ACTN|nr:hypothetical protein [Nonomuraea dietziae]MBB3726280.1 hypothetical protein [Nonomuraea dietziae]